MPGTHSQIQINGDPHVVRDVVLSHIRDEGDWVRRSLEAATTRGWTLTTLFLLVIHHFFIILVTFLVGLDDGTQDIFGIHHLSHRAKR